jgi:GNAT superfamily N-acetyltransferase
LWPLLVHVLGIGNAYRKQSSERNKSAFKGVVKKGPPPGLIAFDGDMAVGWCQLTRRDALPWLDHARRLKRVDDAPVWSISCFYVHKGYRRQGVTSALIAAALKAAKSVGAPALEAYPLDANFTSSASSTGYVSTFSRAGFKIVGYHTPSRLIVRRDLGTTTAQAPSPSHMKKKSKN